MNIKKLGKDIISFNIHPIIYRIRIIPKYLFRCFTFRLYQLINLGKDFKDIPVIINNRNRLSSLTQFIAQLEKFGMNNIYILDNDSTYPPLLEYYQNTKHRVIKLNKNVGHLALWQTDVFKKFKANYYIYTDSDLVLIEECPPDFIHFFMKALYKYPTIDKVGFGLKIDDLPDSFEFKKDVIELENKYWQEKINDMLYNASIDTTFALYRPYTKGGYWLKALRAGFPYLAKHLPWYVDSNNLPEEELFYKKNASNSSYWVNQKMNA